MTNGAARARLRLRDANGLANPGRTRIEQNRIGACVKIFLRPGDVLASFFAGAAMTTGGTPTSEIVTDSSTALGMTEVQCVQDFKRLRIGLV